MLDGETLRKLLNQASRRDDPAFADSVRQLGELLRRAARAHLPRSDPLRRFFDSLDVSQSVLLNFLSKAGAGAFHFDSPEKLRALLRKMAADKVIDKKRQAEALQRDWRRDAGSQAALDLPQAGRTPEEIVADRELYQEVSRRLTDREREMAHLKAAGHTYPEIAARTGMQANTARMALERALRRVAGELSGDGEPGPSAG